MPCTWSAPIRGREVEVEVHVRLEISHDIFLADPLPVRWMLCRVTGLGTAAGVVSHHRLVWFYAHVTQISCEPDS